ncbi:MAG: DUF1648 domain-containing protein [Bryobacterales bacterium]|nr:DUF1648 domain-containing protein [Bryobacterales bacterium]
MSELRRPDRDPVIARWIVPAVAVSFLLLGAAGVALLAQYGGLPDRFPTHYGIDGKADAFHAKSAAIVAMPVVMGVLGSACWWRCSPMGSAGGTLPRGGAARGNAGGGSGASTRARYWLLW